MTGVVLLVKKLYQTFMLKVFEITGLLHSLCNCIYCDTVPFSVRSFSFA